MSLEQDELFTRANRVRFRDVPGTEAAKVIYDLCELVERQRRVILQGNKILKDGLEKAKMRLASVGMMHSIDDGPAIQLKRCFEEGQRGYEEARIALTSATHSSASASAAETVAAEA